MGNCPGSSAIFDLHVKSCSRTGLVTRAYVRSVAALALITLGFSSPSFAAETGLLIAFRVEQLDAYAGGANPTNGLAIGGTRAKAIGGTRAKAIGGTRAKAIGGTRAKAIGGTRAKAIGGTRAKAIGGTRAKAIGGTRAKGVAFSYALANLNGTGATDYFSSNGKIGVDPSIPGRPMDRLVWNDVSYDWLIVGPAHLHAAGNALSLPGATAEIPASNLPSVANAMANGELIALFGYSDSSAVTVVATGMPFVEGSTEIVLIGQLHSIGSDGILAMSSGVRVDANKLPEGTLAMLSEGAWISVRGTYFPAQ